jgi:hypothetical protein
MRKTALYTYMGTNGSLTTPIHLEGIQYILQYRLEAEGSKVLTNGTEVKKIVTIPADKLDDWKEVYNVVSSK